MKTGLWKEGLTENELPGSNYIDRDKTEYGEDPRGKNQIEWLKIKTLWELSRCLDFFEK